MNENIDLTKILKDCPKGTKLYCPMLGEVYFKEIRSDDEYSIITIKGCHSATFTEEGFYYADADGECLLFPSRDQRDWSKFTAPWYKKEKFDKNMVKPKFKVGDRIRHKETNRDNIYEISKVYNNSYGIDGSPWMINMEYQDKYELVPNKFDPKTLKAFDRVITRCDHTYTWSCDFFFSCLF